MNDETNEEIWTLCESILADGLLDETLPVGDFVVETYDDMSEYMQHVRGAPGWEAIRSSPMVYIQLSCPAKVMDFMNLFENGVVVTAPAKKHRVRSATLYWKKRGDLTTGDYMDKLRSGRESTESQYIKAKVVGDEIGANWFDPKTQKPWDGIEIFRISMHRPHESKDNVSYIVDFEVSDASVAFLYRYGQDFLSKVNHEYVKKAVETVMAKKDEIEAIIERNRAVLSKKKEKQSIENLLEGCSRVIHGSSVSIDIVPITNRLPWTYDEFANGSVFVNNYSNPKIYKVFPKRAVDADLARGWRR